MNVETKRTVTKLADRISTGVLYVALAASGMIIQDARSDAKLASIEARESNTRSLILEEKLRNSEINIIKIEERLRDLEKINRGSL